MTNKTKTKTGQTEHTHTHGRHTFRGQIERGRGRANQAMHLDAEFNQAANQVLANKARGARDQHLVRWHGRREE